MHGALLDQVNRLESKKESKENENQNNH